ncbi:MAG: hypothetical protein H0V88_00380 [Pyrinomonadaceae bacterium]|nr:hypothetical protein [Pyrinomonadaceae bacterium]
MQVSKTCLLAVLLLMLFCKLMYAQTSKSACSKLLTGSEPVLVDDATYFSPDLFNSETAAWYAEYLRKMKEPPFPRLIDCGVESYRFLWLRTFHHPVSIRVWRLDEQIFLTIKELNGKGGYEPGKIIVNKNRRLTKGEWLTFKGLVERSSFWQLTTDNRSPITEDADGTITVTTDGAKWILEGIQQKRYHIVARQSAEGTYRNACLYLIKLSGLMIKRDEIY